MLSIDASMDGLTTDLTMRSTLAKNLSLRDKLIIGGFLIVFIPFLIAGTIIYLQLSTSLLDISKQKAMHIARDIAESIDEMLTQQIKLVSAITADPCVVEALQTGDYRLAQLKLEKLHARIGESYFTFFITDKNGIVRADAVFKHQTGLNVADRDYFIKARHGEANATGPIKPRGALKTEDSIIVVSAPILDNGDFYGIAAIPLNTDLLIQIISQHQAEQTGYAYLIDDRGTVIAHPRREFILKLALLDLPGTEAIRQLVMAKQDGIADYSFEGYEKIAGFSRVKNIGWTAAFTQNRDEIMSPVNRLIFSLYISGVFFLIVTVLIIILFSRRFSTPIQKMMEMRKQVTRHSTEIILQIGLDRKIAFANPAFAKATGLDADAVIGTAPCLDNLHGIAPDEIWKVLESGDSWSGRVACKGHKPELVTMDVMLVPLRDDGGTIHGYLLIGRDVSAELMYEKRMQQAQKLEAIGTLSGGIAHDFNNILSGIFGYAELALMKIDSAADTQRYIKQIKVASERARDLVSQILTFSRKTDVELRPLMPKSVLKEAMKLLRASIPAKIDIKLDLNSDSMIMAEPTQLHQIVMNLFMNAVHAIGEQSGTITLCLEDFPVDEEFTRTHPNIKKGRHIRLSVSDTGGGIEPAILDQIYEPFFTTKPQGQGTGLGLSVVHGIVKKLNGIITVYSEVGQGTVFNIIIPATQTDASTWRSEDDALRGGSERIVIIDDEQSIASTLQVILENLGYRVTAFTDSSEALLSIEQRSHEIDILITDYSMPRLTGLEIAERLHAAGTSMPIILTTGFLEKSIEDRARQAGIREFVIKPINSYKITDAIHRIMEKKAKERLP